MPAELDEDGDDALSAAQLLSVGGPFDREFEQFEQRPSQIEMASLVERAVQAKDKLIVEAPAGCGKTYAYLVAILKQKKRLMISTASHYLQSQLVSQDIPKVQQALATSCSVAILKGRSNYLCPYYLEKALQQEHLGSASITREQRGELGAIARRFHHTACGELDRVAPGLTPQLLSHVTASSESCLGSMCPKYKQCPLMIARQRAQQADIVVINHSLLFSNHSLRKENFGELLPTVDAVVVDEAHRLAEFGQRQLGERISKRQLSYFFQQAGDILQAVAPEQRHLLVHIARMVGYIESLQQLALQTQDLNQPLRQDQREEILKQMLAGIEPLNKAFESLQSRDFSLQELQIRCQRLLDKLTRIKVGPGLCWFESQPGGFLLHSIPVDIARLSAELFAETAGSWLFTSATLSVSDDGRQFSSVLGLQDLPFHSVSSDFDYQSRVKLYLPPIAAEPGDDQYPASIGAAAQELLAITPGRVLMLFSSHDMLQKVHRLLASSADQTLFVQGQLDNHLLVAQFKQALNSVLMGTGSFWEGLDLSGVPLAAVIIDKLPFAPPNDPLIKYRSDELSHYGVDSFNEFLLADAVIRLRQGCGRLLRRKSDRGVIMLADPRLQTRAYGSTFLDSLPPMERVTTLAPLIDFFAYENSSA